MVVMEALSPRALERRLKRHFLKETHSFFAVCALGFEDVVEQELLKIGRGQEGRGDFSPPLPRSPAPLLEISGKEPGGVAFTGPLELMYHSNLHVRGAHRILLRIDDFLAQSYPMLFNKASKVPWELYLPKKFNIQVSSKSSRLHQHKTIAKTLNDAIQEKLKSLGLNSKLTDDASLEIHVRLFQDRCTLSINTSGDHLHKRGYRQLVSDAPIRETLAASLLQTLDISSYDLIVDPMCGSGTFPIEAALLGQNIAPGLQRQFAFEALPGFQASKWERFKREAKEEAHATKTTFLGFDIDPENITLANENAKRAGVQIDFEVADATRLKLPNQGQSLLISNLPYGERLESSVLPAFAKNLSQNFKGWSFAFVCKNTHWLQKFNFKELKRFENGGLKVLWVTGQI
jgi:putative N6-adenine-specific DNA methylase